MFELDREKSVVLVLAKIYEDSVKLKLNTNFVSLSYYLQRK